MRKPEALSISIGVLGAVDTYITATLILVPVWVTFIAWASFFIVGGELSGLQRSLAANLMGVVISFLTLLTIATLGENALVAAICVGIGSAAMVQASKIPLLSATPAIVWGFASTVGTTAVTEVPITSASMTNPAIVTAVAMTIGALFGYLSEILGNALCTKTHPTA